MNSTSQQRHVHSDITDFSSDIVVNLYSKEFTSGNLVEMNVYLQIGTKSTTEIQVLLVTDAKGFIHVCYLTWGTFTGSDSSTIRVRADESESMVNETASSGIREAYNMADEPHTIAAGSLEYNGFTTNADNPFILKGIRYRRAWLE